jgi:hypothetical protein
MTCNFSIQVSLCLPMLNCSLRGRCEFMICTRKQFQFKEGIETVIEHEVETGLVWSDLEQL